MARDTSERGRTRRSVLAQFEATVRGAHAHWVEPTSVFADVVLDNGGRLDRLAEIAATMVSQRMRRREAAA
jgi:uridine kinase